MRRAHISVDTPWHPAFLRVLVDHLPVLVYVRILSGPEHGSTCLWNATAEIATGYPATAVLGRRPSDVFCPDLARVMDAMDSSMLANPMVHNQADVAFTRSDGQVLHMHCASLPLFDQSDQPRYLLGIAQDISLIRQQTRALVTNQAELAAAYHASPLGLFQTDAQGRCGYVNRRYESIAGLAQESTRGYGWLQAIHPQDRIQLFRAWRDATRGGAIAQQDFSFQVNLRFVHAGGRIVWASMKTAPIVIDGAIQGYSATVDDISERVQHEQAMAESEQRLRTVADTLPALVAWVDSDLHLRFANKAWEDQYASPGEPLRDKALSEFLDPAEYHSLLPHLQRALAGERVVFERESGANEHYRCVESTFIPQLTEGRRVAGLHLMVQDVTARKLEQARLQRLAEMDSLTGLYNRDGFRRRMQAALDKSAREQTLLAVMFLDLDYFKAVNDSYGHHTGDLMLQAFAGRLCQALRASDTIGRLGGDEFTVIMEDLAREADAEAIALKIVQAVQTPFFLNGVTVSIGVSVGLAFCRNGNVDPNVLLQKADAMLYGAKQDGRNLYKVARLEDVNAA
jgi:diguanylate cyclase (GGDEF)-like protein/PAS domain S-box-containing protein